MSFSFYPYEYPLKSTQKRTIVYTDDAWRRRVQVKEQIDALKAQYDEIMSDRIEFGVVCSPTKFQSIIDQLKSLQKQYAILCVQSTPNHYRSERDRCAR